MNNEVAEAVLSQLKAGKSRVRLSAAQLPTVAFESRTSDLYWGFRGTQGLTVTGSGRRENGRYVGILSYVIRDSYGFPVGDTLEGFGPPAPGNQFVTTVNFSGGTRQFAHATGGLSAPGTFTATGTEGTYSGEYCLGRGGDS